MCSDLSAAMEWCAVKNEGFYTKCRFHVPMQCHALQQERTLKASITNALTLSLSLSLHLFFLLSLSLSLFLFVRRRMHFDQLFLIDAPFVLYVIEGAILQSKMEQWEKERQGEGRETERKSLREREREREVERETERERENEIEGRGEKERGEGWRERGREREREERRDVVSGTKRCRHAPRRQISLPFQSAFKCSRRCTAHSICTYKTQV
jgi:hypothetical protein